MRETLFRGKSEKFGNWIEGSLIVCRDLESGRLEYLIAPLSAYYTEVKKVIPETVGQYTGLTDKNGKKIFEGDVVIWCGIKGIVVWKGHKFYIKSNLLWDFSDDDCIEVIGNIHDNRELLGGK